MRNKARSSSFSRRLPSFIALLLFPSLPLSCVCLSPFSALLPPVSKQLPLLSLKKMKADESIWPVALKCTCLHPSLGGGDNEPID